MKLVSLNGDNTELIINDSTVEYRGEVYDIVIHDGDVGQAGHISTNNFVVKHGQDETLVERFSNRKGNVDKYDGFRGFMLIRADQKMSVLTGWESSEDFEAWVNSEAFQNSHVKKEERVKNQGSDHLESMPTRENYKVER
ncbi:antibiotic biosynthesis monooxygenase family protein [Aliicoccus persicus]|uniref:Signal transduction protein TRAP n=1 Tax=Aliicoccus persicus TaxID=930138 RepID=A0A662Z3X1_9STAP|nr:antibiotic biosynthesis monooxygenase [Aliicoccus persicus]SEV86764.1 Heme-degrading monooxygenase HmoA [Aliicoccus persicus]